MATETWTVVSADARIRKPTSQGQYELTRKRIPRLTQVRIAQVDGDQVRVLDARKAIDLGWTAASNLARLYKDRPALLRGALGPPKSITSGTGSRRQRRIAATYNRLGGLLTEVAASLRIPLTVLLGIWYVESGGVAQRPNHAFIRFENHVFFRRWGKDHAASYDAHFQHGGRAPQQGHRAYRRHHYRVSNTGAWTRLHVASVTLAERQRREYEAKDLAARLSNEEIALACISYGGPQIMGFNHLVCGYRTAKELYRALQTGERAQVLAFADFMAWRGSDRTRGYMLRLARNKRWQAFGRAYNGSSRYGSVLAAAVADAESVLQTLSRVEAKTPTASQAHYGAPSALFNQEARPEAASSLARPGGLLEMADAVGHVGPHDEVVPYRAVAVAAGAGSQADDDSRILVLTGAVARQFIADVVNEGIRRGWNLASPSPSTVGALLNAARELPAPLARKITQRLPWPFSQGQEGVTITVLVILGIIAVAAIFFAYLMQRDKIRFLSDRETHETVRRCAEQGDVDVEIGRADNDGFTADREKGTGQVRIQGTGEVRIKCARTPH